MNLVDIGKLIRERIDNSEGRQALGTVGFVHMNKLGWFDRLDPEEFRAICDLLRLGYLWGEQAVDATRDEALAEVERLREAIKAHHQGWLEHANHRLLADPMTNTMVKSYHRELWRSLTEGPA